jgi:hypothetical protein
MFAAENQYTRLFCNVKDCFAFIGVFLLLARFMVINGQKMVMFLACVTSANGAWPCGFSGFMVIWSLFFLS